MKRLLFTLTILFVCCFAAQAQVTSQNARRLPSGSGAPTVACVAGPPFIQYYTDTSTSPPTIYTCKSGTWTATAGGAVAAPIAATYITQTPNAALTNEQALSLLATGIPLVTTTTGAISISSVTNDAQTKAAIVPNTAPSAGQILVGNAGGTAYAPVPMSGDATLGSTGAITLASTISAGGPTGSATVAPIITYDAKGRLTTVSSATITPAVGSITGLGTGVGTALGVNVGTAGAFVVNGGALGSPSTAGTLPAHTLGGTISGGGNQINNVVIGTSTPLAGTFTTLVGTTVNGLTITNNGTNTLSITAGKTLTTLKTISLTAADDTGVYTLPTGTKTLLATDGVGTSLTGIPYTLTGTANQITLSAGTGNITFSLPQSIATTSTPQFLRVGVGAASDASTGVKIVNATGTGSQYGIDLAVTGASTANVGAYLSATGATSNYALQIAGPSAGANNYAIKSDATAQVLFAGPIVNTGITSDATHTDSAVCQDTTTHQYYAGSGAAGICLGTSSSRFKNSIRDLGDGLDKLVNLRPRTFFYDKNYGDGGAHLQYGFIAEEMKGVLPSLVRPDAEGNPQSIDYGALWPIMVKAIQDLNVKVERLEHEKTSIRNPVRRHHRARAN